MAELTIRVPATSANLGPGFDCLGMAVTCWNEFTFSPASDVPDRHLALTAYQQTCAALGHRPLTLAVTGHGDVPMTRGLGSSSTCIVAGVLAAGALHGIELDPQEAVRLATVIEGHPDNVAPAILGGIVTSVVADDGAVLSVPIPLARDLELLALIPDHELSTEQARNSLPDSVSRADAVFTASHVALLVAALASGDELMLAEAFRDRLHQPYRAHLIPGVTELLAAARPAGALGSYLSGAGPTVMVVGPGPMTRGRLTAHLSDHPWSWEFRSMAVSSRGAHIV